MALIGNRSVLLKSPGRYFGGSTVSDNRSNFGAPGSTRGRYFGGFPAINATPSGYRPPYSWIMAIKNGEMSSINSAGLSINGSGDGAMGLPATGDASFLIDFAIASGQLIASGHGSSTFAISSNTPLLTASLNGLGSATFVISGATTTLTALGDMGASATFSVIPLATILPANDASPLRTASATLSLSGSLASYALGSMTGSTAGGGGLTVDAIAAGVIAAAQITPIHADTKKMNGATLLGNGTSGNKWRG